MNPTAMRCRVDWQGRFRCGQPGCARCRKRQIRREYRAVMERLDAPGFRFMSVKITLGATDDIKGVISRLRSDLRNRLNLCRQASRRWADAAIWGWFAVVENGSGQFEISAHSIVRIGRLLGQADVYEAVIGTWDKPGQVEAEAAIGHDSLPALARSVIETAFAQDCHYPSFSDFRGLRFRFGRAQMPSARNAPVFYESMPLLF